MPHSTHSSLSRRLDTCTHERLFLEGTAPGLSLLLSTVLKQSYSHIQPSTPSPIGWITVLGATLQLTDHERFAFVLLRDYGAK